MLKIEKFTDVCMTGGMHYTPVKAFFFQISPVCCGQDVHIKMLLSSTFSKEHLREKETYYLPLAMSSHVARCLCS